MYYYVWICGAGIGGPTLTGESLDSLAQWCPSLLWINASGLLCEQGGGISDDDLARFAARASVGDGDVDCEGVLEIIDEPGIALRLTMPYPTVG